MEKINNSGDYHSPETTMFHFHTQITQEPDWVACCVEKQCSFGNHNCRYICPIHYSMHICSVSSCFVIRAMVRQNCSHIESTECPVAALVTFRTPELEFRGPHDTRASIEVGYSAPQCPSGAPGAGMETEGYHMLLKACIPITVALFSTLLTEEFKFEYDSIHWSKGPNRTLWMTKISESAKRIELEVKPKLYCSKDYSSVVKEAVLKTTVAIASLFGSQDKKTRGFTKKMTLKYNDKLGRRTDFYTYMVMLGLCFFPYLKHNELDELFESKTLVLMCFDKTHTRHKHWSKLSTLIHLHVHQRAFTERFLIDQDFSQYLPIVVIVTLEKCIMDASYTDYMNEDPNQGKTHEKKRKMCSQNTQHGNRKALIRKRRKPCPSAYYEMDGARLEEKVTRLSNKETYSELCTL